MCWVRPTNEPGRQSWRCEEGFPSLSVAFCPLCAFYDHATPTQEGLSCLSSPPYQAPYLHRKDNQNRARVLVPGELVGGFRLVPIERYRHPKQRKQTPHPCPNKPPQPGPVAQPNQSIDRLGQQPKRSRVFILHDHESFFFF